MCACVCVQSRGRPGGRSLTLSALDGLCPCNESLWAKSSPCERVLEAWLWPLLNRLLKAWAHHAHRLRPKAWCAPLPSRPVLSWPDFQVSDDDNASSDDNSDGDLVSDDDDASSGDDSDSDGSQSNFDSDDDDGSSEDNSDVSQARSSLPARP